MLHISATITTISMIPHTRIMENIMGLTLIVKSFLMIFGLTTLRMMNKCEMAFNGLIV